MTLSNVALNNTFLDQMTRINQLVIIMNSLTEGQGNISGALTITNSSHLRGNVSLEVTSGVIKGDGGLISNVQTSSLTSNTINVVSNSTSLTVSSGLVQLGQKVFINVATSTGTSDNSSSNLTTANITNTIWNSVLSTNTIAYSALSTAQGAFATANSGGGALSTAQAAFSQANTSMTEAIAAFGQANTSNIVGQGAFALAQTAYSAANSAGAGAFSLAQTAYGQANTALTTAQAAFAAANSSAVSNVVTLTIGSTTNADLSTGVNFYLLLTQNTTLNITNTRIQSGFIQLQQNASGNFAVTWSNPPIKFSGNVKPIITRTPNANDIFFYTVINSNFVLGSVVSNVS